MLGTAPDLLDAAVYFGDGDMKNAGQSAAMAATFMAGDYFEGRRLAKNTERGIRAYRAWRSANKVEGVVYMRIDPSGEIKPYIGQANSAENYARRQTTHNKNYQRKFNYVPLERPKTQGDLDFWEEYYIRDNGGPTNKSNPYGGLSNKRHQMNDIRFSEEVARRNGD